eukprot:IDg22009t1
MYMTSNFPSPNGVDRPLPPAMTSSEVLVRPLPSADTTPSTTSALALLPCWGIAASASCAPVAGDTALPCTDNPWDDMYVPKPRLPDDAPASPYDKAYFFLMRANYSIIRDFIRSLNVQEKRAAEISSSMSGSATNCDTWYAEPARIGIVVPHAPSLAALLGTMPVAIRVTGRSAQPPAPDFCTNEFARLVGVLVDSGPYIRGKLLETALSLDRDELDRRVDRDAIWETAIAPRFNDHSIQVR